jgi:hypothetical protein
MQTLGLADSTPRSDNRLKSLFWPSIQTATDVDYLGTQGFWICVLMAVLSLILLVATGHIVAGIITFLFNFLSGVGVRQGSRYAAAMVLILYLLDTFLSGIPIVGAGVAVRVIFIAVLLANLRATWIASAWQPGSEEAVLPTRLNETLGDKLSDQLPVWLWPKIQIAYYIFSACLLLLASIGTAMSVHRPR